MELNCTCDRSFRYVVVEREEYASNIVGSHSTCDRVEEPRDHVRIIIDQKGRD